MKNKGKGLVGRVAHYRWQEGKGQEALNQALKGIIPQLKQQEGFHSYTIVQVGKDEYFTFTLWEDQDAMKHAATVTQLVREQLQPLRSELPQLNPVLGEVVVNERSAV